MKKKHISIGMILLLVTVGLSGCFGDDEDNDDDRFVGTWESDTGFGLSMVLFSDGSCSYAGASGTWEIKDGKLSIELQGGVVSYVFDFYFSDGNSKLYLKLQGTDDYDEWVKQ